MPISRSSSVVATGASAIRSAADRAGDMLSLKDFGGVGDGATDNTAAFNAAFASGKSFTVPAGNFLTQGGHTATTNGQNVIGAGQASYAGSPQGTQITVTTAASAFVTATNVSWLRFAHFTCTRSVTATIGGNFVTFPSNNELCCFEDLLIYGHYNGFLLGSTSDSKIRHCRVMNCISDGIHITNSVVSGTSQWGLSDVICEMNGGWGILVAPTVSASGMSLSTWSTVDTFANTSGGIGFAGTSGCPIFGVRLHDCFIGSDGNYGLFLDTFGSKHMIDGCFFELIGMDATGPGLAHAAPNAGIGINISANNSVLQVNATHIEGCANFGIVSSAADLKVAGCVIIDNGAALVATTRVGIAIAAGTATITGNTIKNTGANTSQQFAVSNTGAINVSVGNDFKTNSSGSFNGTAAVIGGVTLNNQ